ncbi:MAG: flavin-containing monooxygenase [Burkholderiales bacterium]
MQTEHFDVLIVGAGLSGIGAAVHLTQQCRGRSFAIFEGRASSGGTWDLFRYPGIRSDSDMYTLGYIFKPWKEAKAIADGPSILSYIRETAAEYGIESRIRYQHRVKRAAWSTAEARWTVEAQRGDDGAIVRVTCGFLFMCAGYYRYEAGYTPEFPGRERFTGRVVHPQLWPSDIDYKGKRVVVIGSGATAVTLVPELARDAAHVTMLQRSPTYVVARPSVDAIATRLKRLLPLKAAYWLTRWKNVLFGMYIFNLCRKKPRLAKAGIIQRVREALGPDFDVKRHFTPRYDPWTQRMCLVPDADLFESLKSGRASVVTDTIASFTERGILLDSGDELKADLIVTATGLELNVLGGLAVTVDGRAVDFSTLMAYKGMMYEGVPNLASASGYTNASWTLKADLTCDYVCRLINHMQKTGARICTPRQHDPDVAPMPWVDFSSGYFQRAIERLPKQGSRLPWRLHQNYIKDIFMLRFGKVEDATLVFSRD